LGTWGEKSLKSDCREKPVGFKIGCRSVCEKKKKSLAAAGTETTGTSIKDKGVGASEGVFRRLNIKKNNNN